MSSALSVIRLARDSDTHHALQERSKFLFTLSDGDTLRKFLLQVTCPNLLYHAL